MSGRKQCEVAAVLKQGEKVRGVTNGIYRKEIEKDFKNLEDILAQGTALKNRLGEVSAELNGDALEMFGEDGRNRMKTLAALKSEVNNYSPTTGNGKNIISQLDDVDRETVAADREGEEIRRSIRNKNWYCDAEYSRAQNLVGKYRQQGERRKNLAGKMKNLLLTERAAYNDVNAKFGQAKDLAAQILDMNATASRRMQANEQRQKLRESFSALSGEQAKKFFAADYSALEATVKAAESASDSDVIAGFQGDYQKISAFAVKLRERVALWEQQKHDAEDVMGEVKKLSEFSLINPISYYNDGENGEREGLLAYLKKYGGEDLTAIYEDKLRQMQNLMDKEDFTGCRDRAKEILEILGNAKEKGIALQARMLNNTELAGTIQDVLYDMGYDIDLTPLNDNPNDGYRIKCTAGDEIIDFTELSVDSDGKPIVNIDHRESSGGSCAHSWQEIGKRLQAVGIPLTDVKLASGASVVRATQNAAKSAAQGQTMHG